MKSKKIVLTIVLFIIVLLLVSMKWGIDNFDNLSIEELVFHLNGNIVASESGIVIKYLLEAFIPAMIIYIFILALFNMRISNDYLLEIVFFKKVKSIHLKKDTIKKFIKYSINFIMVCTFILFLHKLSFFQYIYYQFNESNYIEDNYTDPKQVSLVFPESKRNLIYIYAESLESTYFKYNGSVNLMPELYEISINNTSFSSTDNNIGGAKVVNGTGWTTGAMVGQTSAIPLKINGNAINNSRLKSFLPNLYNLGDILHDNGYNQEIIFGSKKKFGNKGLLFESHKDYYVYDYNTAIKKGKIDKDYYEWWGFEDSKLFEFSKEEILRLANEEAPFNFTMLTSNTHHPDGYLEKDCDSKYKSNYANAIACSSKQIADFIGWIQQQDFYANTTIVVVGDHLSMKTDFFDNTNIEREVFNVFINATATDNVKNKNREFSTLDFFPTTLASMGVNIDGNRLGLGINLFSQEQTDIEKYGLEYIDKELSKKSVFYNSYFMNKH